MKIKEADSLLFLWSLAEAYALKYGSVLIEPFHFFLAIAKCVDLDPRTFISKETPCYDDVVDECCRESQRVRRIFRTSGLDPKKLRDHIRAEIPISIARAVTDGRLHRSKATKKLFAEARQVAGLCGERACPVHFFLALLCSADRYCDRALLGMKVDIRFLRSITHEEVFSSKGIVRQVKRHLRPGKN